MTTSENAQCVEEVGARCSVGDDFDAEAARARAVILRWCCGFCGFMLLVFAGLPPDSRDTKPSCGHGRDRLCHCRDTMRNRAAHAVARGKLRKSIRTSRSCGCRVPGSRP